VSGKRLRPDPLRRAVSAAALGALPGAAWLAAVAAAPAGARAAQTAAAGTDGGPPKVLRVSFPESESGFDPARISDLYSRTVTPHIFEGLYTYDHLARPYRMKPLTAAAMPEISDDFRVWVIRLRPGIHFQDDPVFAGQPRELVAQDYVYAFQRILDPAHNSPVVSTLLETGIVGLEAARQAAIEQRQPYDYDRPIPGLRAVDRYTLRIEMSEPRPRLLPLLAAGDLLGAQAREVVEHYGDEIVGHPVGTGPFRLTQWRRSSFIALERNPGYRELHYDAEPAPDDAEGQAILARLKGRRLPLVDRVEISIIDESQPRWLSFLNGELDHIPVPGDFVPKAVPNGHLAPYLAARGIRHARSLNADGAYAFFNMEHPLVGGHEPAKVALRRAISLAIDVESRIRLIFRGQAIPAQSILIPHTSGYDPHFKSEMGDHDPARAKALLDLYGYVDRDGDGWREQPDGSPLELEVATQPDQSSRAADELWKKDLNAVGLRVRFAAARWPEQLKAAYAGKLMIWSLGGTAASPDGQDSLAALYSQQIPGQNLARFRLAAMDTLYEQAQRLPDGPERDALFRQAKILSVAYMPYKMMLHRISNDLTQRRLVGYRRPLFWTDWWHMVDIETDVAETPTQSTP